jgi:serine/threonine-protein kinase
LGGILYELLTGQKLFDGNTPPAIMMAHFRPLVLPKAWPEDVPLGIAEVLSTALAKQPKERYATAGEMVKALAG